MSRHVRTQRLTACAAGDNLGHWHNQAQGEQMTERDPNAQADTVEDLDVDEDEADEVKGGRARTADPDEGGE